MYYHTMFSSIASRLALLHLTLCIHVALLAHAFPYYGRFTRSCNSLFVSCLFWYLLGYYVQEVQDVVPSICNLAEVILTLLDGCLNFAITQDLQLAVVILGASSIGLIRCCANDFSVETFANGFSRSLTLLVRDLILLVVLARFLPATQLVLPNFLELAYTVLETANLAASMILSIIGC